MNTLIRTTAILTLVLTAACSQPTGLINVASSPAEDRSFAALEADTGISLRLNEVLLSEQHRDLFFEVSTDVYERRVLLTGTIKHAANKARAGNLVRGIRGVRRVINELQVTDDYGIATGASDLWIETRLKASLLATDNVRSINYRWRSVKGTVYVIGAARSKAELDKVLDVIRRTDRVKKVINHAWVRPPV